MEPIRSTEYSDAYVVGADGGEAFLGTEEAVHHDIEPCIGLATIRKAIRA
jgi:hypothetical protein